MNRFKELSKEFGYKQKDYLDVANMSIDVINNISNNRSSIDDVKLVKLCELFQVTTDYFLCLSNEGIYIDVLGKRCLLSKEKFLLYKSVNKIIYVDGIRTLDVKSIDEIELVNGSVPFVKLRNEIL